MRDGVECAADDPARVGGDSLGERACPLDHLPGRTAGEREQEDPFGRDPLGHQPGDARAQRRGLARAGTREDQQRVARVRGSRTLLDVEFVEKRVGVRIEHLFAHARHDSDDAQAARPANPEKALGLRPRRPNRRRKDERQPRARSMNRASRRRVSVV